MKMYFVAIVLPEELNRKIHLYKKWMAERFNCRVALKSPAHITLLPPFWMEDEKQELLINDLQNLSATFFNFVISTNNFSAFKPKTLFIALEDNQALNELKQKTDAYFNNTDYKIKIETRSFHPHITIATRDLHKKDFAEAWAFFEHKKFQEAFEVKGLSLLKHNGSNWDVIYTIAFSTPV